MADQLNDLIEQARTTVRKEGRLDIEAFLQNHPEAPQELREQLADLVRIWRLLFPISPATRDRVLAGIHAELAVPMPLTVADLVAIATPADLRSLGLTRGDLEPLEDLEEPVAELTAQQIKELITHLAPPAKVVKVAGLLQNLKYRSTGTHNRSALAARPKKGIQLNSGQENGK